MLHGVPVHVARGPPVHVARSPPVHVARSPPVHIARGPRSCCQLTSCLTNAKTFIERIASLHRHDGRLSVSRGHPTQATDISADNVPASVLRIESVRDGDAGVYQCRATAGSDAAQAQAHVTLGGERLAPVLHLLI